MIEKKYSIGGREYYQKELVLYQQEELGKLLDINTATQSMASLLKALFAEGKLAKALSVVLLPYEHIQTREEIEQHLRDHLSMSMQAEIISDFFACNAPALKKWAALGNEAKMTTEPTASL